jgi:hypothetical protein
VQALAKIDRRAVAIVRDVFEPRRPMVQVLDV